MLFRWTATVLAAVAAAAALVGAVEAAMKAGPSVMPGGYHHRLRVPGGAPLDGFTTPSGAYSFRKLRSAYAGAGVRLQRVDTNQQDIGFTAAGNFDAAAAAAFCTTACGGATWYDQSGTARDLTQPTAANQMELVFNCDGALPCWRATVNTQNFFGPSVTPATGIVSFSGVGNRTIGTGPCVWLRENGNANRLITQAVANAWQLVGGSSGTIAAPATDGVWHAAVGAITGAPTSYINVDGATVTGTATGTTIGAAVAILGAASTTCLFGESVFWDNYTLAAGEAAALIANQRSFGWIP